MAKKDPVKTQLRIPPVLREQLSDAVVKSGRSMNAEIVHRLAESFAYEEFPPLSEGVPDEAEPLNAEERAMLTIAKLQSDMRSATRSLKYLEETYEKLTGLHLFKFVDEDASSGDHEREMESGRVVRPKARNSR